MSDLCNDFIQSEVLALTIMGAFGRSRTYAENTSDQKKAVMREDLKSRLKSIGEKYKNPVPELAHVAEIEKLGKGMTSDYSSILFNGTFRVGTSQKALNLYLKYLWALQWIPEPPHCPVDSIVLSKIPGLGNVKWTQIDSMEQYVNCITAAKKVAEPNSIARWELELWNIA